MVGIGTADPKALLNINNTIDSTYGNTIRYYGTGDTQFSSESIWLGKSGLNSTQNYWGMSLGVIYDGHSYIQTLDTKDDIYYNLLLNPNGGNVGIASTNPAYPLTVGAYSQPNTEVQLLRYFDGTGIEERSIFYCWFMDCSGTR
ncbi:MAG: hypothetical protein ACXABD_01625 [Candidatus Thorarchaeota archaeon]|jgi:hypothetical protein